MFVCIAGCFPPLSSVQTSAHMPCEEMTLFSFPGFPSTLRLLLCSSQPQIRPLLYGVVDYHFVGRGDSVVVEQVYTLTCNLKLGEGV